MLTETYEANNLHCVASVSQLPV